MIQLPKRSVTRFFIPLVDVMTLLFCIFLLMPMVKPENPEASPAERLPVLEAQLREREDEIARLQRELREVPEELKKEIDRLRQEKMETLSQRLLIRVLEVEGGKLYYRNPDPLEIHNQADADALIAQDKRSLGNSKQEMYYLLRVPSDPSKVALTTEERQKFERWFAMQAHGWDLGSGAVRGGQP